MKRAIFTAFALMLPLTAAAQEPAPASAVPDAERPIAAAIVSASLAPATDLAAPASQPSATRRASKRRGSMVGYIEDPTVTSQVRVRFDSGRGVNAPDRAEFFYGKCGCYRDLPASHPLHDADAPGPGPGIVEDMNFQELHVLAEFAVKPRVSIFGELPVRWIQPKDFITDTGSFDNQGGLGDIRAGAKFSAFSSDTSDVTLLVRGSFASGDSRKGLGTNHGAIEPALLVRGGMDRVSVEAQFGAVFPTGGSKGIGSGDEKFSGNVLYYGIGPSIDLIATDHVRFSPVVELVGWRVLGGFVTNGFAPADGTNIVNLKIGARTTIKRGSFYAGFGWGLTDAVWYDKLFRLEYRAGF
jgi:hypothetical protein